MPCYPRLSHAADGLSANVYTSLLAIAEQSGRELFPLNVGDTYLEPPDCGSVEALAKQRFAGMHRYAPVRGEPVLLDAIVNDLERRGRAVPRDQLQVTAGGTSALDLTCRALLEPGDEVILLAPYWPLIRGIVSACGAVAVELPCFTELRTPEFDFRAALERVVTPRTAAIYVNSPNNPTGLVLDAQEVEVLAHFIHERGLWLLSDEAYERLHFSAPGPAVWQHPKLTERAVVVHTLSKSYAMAGARVAYLHAPPRALEAIAGLQTFATYCAPRPLQIAACNVLVEPEGEAFVARAQEAYQQAAARTARTLRQAPPAAGTFAFFDTRRFLKDGESSQALLERVARAGVVLTPGAATGAAYADWARLCFTSVAPATLERALAALEAVLYP
jgi:N-succinyldiaminopimelate aminotransferase